MPDEADLAQKNIEQEEEIRRMQREARTVSIVVSRETCIECENDIPEGRQTAIPGVEHCVYCAGLIEARH